ncbi:MAG: TetR/AcrR family transcriptional regulator [Opitutales bacterium]
MSETLQSTRLEAEPRTSPDSTDTRSRILAAASRIFVQKGFNGASLRNITQAAGVNLAAVNYHFGSKDRLIWEVLRERIEPINSARMRMLDDALKATGGEPLPVEVVVDAFLEPIEQAMLIQRQEDDPILVALVARMYTETPDFFRRLFENFFKDLSERFVMELGRSLPEFPPEEVHHRYMMVVALMIGVIMHHAKCAEVSNKGFPVEPVEQVMARLRHFVLSGLRQPMA